MPLSAALSMWIMQKKISSFKLDKKQNQRKTLLLLALLNTVFYVCLFISKKLLDFL